MATQLDRYLKVMVSEAKKYGVDPLFVKTDISRFAGSVDVDYQSEALGKRRSKRSLTFSFYVTRDEKSENKKEFIPLKDIMAFEYPEIYEVIFHFDRGVIELDIEKSEVKDFNVSTQRNPFYLECLDGIENGYGSMKPEDLLRVLAIMHALGTDDFSSVEILLIMSCLLR